MKKIFIILTLFSLFNFVNVSAEEVIDENVTTKDETVEVIGETPIPAETTPKENLIDETNADDIQVISEEVKRTVEEDSIYTTTGAEEDLIQNMSGSQNYAVYYVAIGVVVLLLISVWIFIFSKARQMKKD